MSNTTNTEGLTLIAVTIPDACKMSSLGRSFLYEKLNEGVIKSVKVGKRRLVLVASMADYLTSLPTATKDAVQVSEAVNRG